MNHEHGPVHHSQAALDQDNEHLRLLTLFHYITAALVALCSSFPIIHLVMGIAMVTGAMDQPGQQGPPTGFGYIFIAFAVVFIAIGWACAVMIFFAGRFLRDRKNHLFCMVVAGLSCFFMPIGTILGVFTIVVLNRAGVKEQFAA